MRNILLLISLFVTGLAFGQEKSSFDFGVGYSQTGGLSFSFASKTPGAFGWYIASRGLNIEGDYDSGTDYSKYVNTSIKEYPVEDTKDFGITAGTIYNFKNSIFSIGGGAGYGIDGKLEKISRVHDFTILPDEHSVSYYNVSKGTITGEIFLDISLKKNLKNTFGIQAGYNTLQKAFGIVYYAF
ncbi:hypothetical protein [Riemerella anatipestifer]|uniref:hypothetical protein n=1 Tax=Riemerella anatipestifer TaxID=34085 RepID=UPI00129E2577|nr:hypothetical protein [Riemerella anatipestifer]MBT0551161.1 hypothetical protein [Riemerella anatipestifer]MBT0552984.1 hypothetical protein [Riemerella anatipestifer]MCE3025247.1 hypothetical protein [Riemerella anatipestifer]MCU7558694.1 hypothetical protein [Riemerella anatipestifer]MDY3448385.1 hypothetical protein [Riemerella anatipestifer]